VNDDKGLDHVVEGLVEWMVVVVLDLVVVWLVEWMMMVILGHVGRVIGRVNDNGDTRPCWWSDWSSEWWWWDSAWW